MLKEFPNRLVWSTLILCLVPLTVLSQDETTAPEPKATDKPELIEVQLKVTDKKTGDAVDNADVLVRWGEGDGADSENAVTNSKGIARLKNVPRGSVMVRVIANGYRATAPSVDLKDRKQPIKIELERQTHDSPGGNGVCRAQPLSRMPALV
jgi:Carboxypeptidase regulatory-like domain